MSCADKTGNGNNCADRTTFINATIGLTPLETGLLCSIKLQKERASSIDALDTGFAMVLEKESEDDRQSKAFVNISFRQTIYASY